MAAILANPKAILFYMGVLPGFFDLQSVGAPDIVAICTLSFAIPLVGNLGFAAFIGRVRSFVSSPAGIRRLNRGAGALLMLVGLVIPFT